MGASTVSPAFAPLATTPLPQFETVYREIKEKLT